ncbi:MAG: CTP synthase, partial [Dehalococcoidales bacterium]|nr:CTP synthase [Dehalococcoidales bacterium]
QKMDKIICDRFNITKKINLKPWVKVISNYNELHEETIIAVVGKYVELEDAYISVKEALKHAGLPFHCNVKVSFVNARELNETNYQEVLKDYDGILVPGGFGLSGIDGKILAIKYARENKVPFLGICLGLQLAVIEYAQNVLKLEGANSTEFDPETKYPIINYLPDQYTGINLGGTMRLGAYDCDIKEKTLAYEVYNSKKIKERHRHRYEFDNNYRLQFEEQGMIFSGINPQSNLVEIIELKAHPYYIASQFHPEFKSRPTKAHPLFCGLVKASIANFKKKSK